MAFDREAVYSALLTRLQAKLPSPATLPQPISRRARDLTQIGPDEQPAAFLVCGNEQILPGDRGQAATHKFYAQVLIYVRTDDPAQAPSTILFPLIQLVEQACAWAPGDNPQLAGGSTTLGAIGAPSWVSHCKLVGIEINDGLPSGEGTALCTIELLTFGNVAGTGT